MQRAGLLDGVVNPAGFGHPVVVEANRRTIVAISSDAAIIAAAQLAAAQILVIEPPAEVAADREKLQNWILEQFNWYKDHIRPNALRFEG